MEQGCTYPICAWEPCAQPITDGVEVWVYEIDGEKRPYHQECSRRLERNLRRAARREQQAKEGLPNGTDTES